MTEASDRPGPAARGRRLGPRAALAAASLGATLAAAEGVARLARVHVGTVQISRGTVRPSADPLLRFELAPGGFARGEVDYAINAHGLRGPETSLAKPEATRRIVILGDSIAFGYWVAERDAFPRQLEALLAAAAPPGERVEVLDFGVPSYALDQELHLLRTRAGAFRPDVVILAFCLNDLELGAPYELGLVADRSARRATAAGRLLERLVTRSRFAAWLEYRLTELSARRSFARERSPLPDSDFEPLARGRERLDRAFAELAEEVGRLGATGLVAVFPLFTAPLSETPWRPLHALVAESARRAGLGALDLLDCLAAYPLDELRVDALHPQPLGHRVAAHALRDALCAGALPCRPLPPEPACTGYSAADFPRVRGY
jgi:lysophospholipase L1-like esterase